MATKEEIRQIVKEEVSAALSLSLPLLAERIEQAISSPSVDSRSHSGCTSHEDGPESSGS